MTRLANRSDELVNSARGTILQHALDTVLHRSGRLIHFALTDDLMIAGFQNEVVFIVFAFAAVEAGRILRILLHRCDAVPAAGFRLIHLTGENGLSIGRFEIEMELTVLGFLDFKFSGHGVREVTEWSRGPLLEA